MFDRPSFYHTAVRPLLFAMNAEAAHDFTMQLLAQASRFPGLCAWAQHAGAQADTRLHQKVWSLSFSSPVGLAAGLDKNGVAINALAACGFSHVEIGTVTGRAQPGNPQPRLFRLRDDQAIINRMGFNNRGATALAQRLARSFEPVGGRRRPPCVLGINLGKSKIVDNTEALSDYEQSLREVARYADYLVVNVSSPNTPGLRDLQAEASLRPLLAGIRACVDRCAPGTPLLLKIAPDLSDAGVDAAVDVAGETGCDGLIASNTTIGRTGLTADPARIAAIGAGGLSGPPVRDRALAVLARCARRLRASPRPIPVIGVGGIDDAETAWRRITHGATLVQIYTAMIYHGPAVIQAINQGLSQRVQALGLHSISAAIGRDL